MSAVTIYDVASEAGVSIATVSKVLNDKAKVRPETRLRVLQAVERLGFRPNNAAAALSGKGTRTLGLILPDISNPFFAGVARCVEDSAREHGYSLVICNTDGHMEREAEYVEVLRSKQVDGFIFASAVQGNTVISQLVAEDIPVVVMVRELPGAAVSTVVMDDFLGGCLAVRHLIELGHRNIAYVAGPLRATTMTERLRGYVQALSEVGLDYQAELVLSGTNSTESGSALAARLLARPDRPTAIFAASDLLAAGVYQAAAEAGLRVPHDLSVVGYDNSFFSRLLMPPLTTVAQPMQQLGAEAAHLAIAAITGSDAGVRRIVLQPELVVRGSTAPIQRG